MLRLSLIVLVAFTGSALSSASVCSKTFCSCSNDVHPAWTTVNCSVPQDMRLDFITEDLPTSIMELNIRGAAAVMFGSGAFNGLTDIRRIKIRNTKMVLFRQFAAVDLSVLNLYLELDRCDIVRFEKSSFVKLRGPMSVAISNCEAVNVEGDTFSWLLNLEISNVRELLLASGSFSLDPTAANVAGDHGPGMSVELKNVTIPEFPRSTFGSSAAKVYLEGVDVHAIRTGAFSANTYNVVLAINCSIHLIEQDAFSENSLINYLNLIDSNIQHLSSRALRSAIANIEIKQTRFDYVETGAINTTVASVKIISSEFHIFMEKGFELSSWNTLQIENNSFDELPTNAIAAPGASIHKLIFKNNEIETMHPGSLSFIGKAATTEIHYLNNYYGQACYCNISQWLSAALEIEDGHDFEANSYCTVNEILARCFNVPDQNMLVRKFIANVCAYSTSIQCEQLKSKNDGEIVEIKNPRFPHNIIKNDELSSRNKKVIGIVVVSCLCCFVIAILFSLYKWWRRGSGGCASLKAIFISLNTACTSMCGRICPCGRVRRGSEHVRSISQSSVNEYSERHRLNEARAQDVQQESSFQEDATVLTSEKFTQTLPEELTKELLENLKERLDNPDNYVEARDIIEHLYELTKITEEAAKEISSSTTAINIGENIYELPYQNTTIHIGPNIKTKVSVGTRIPSLEKLSPLSPYYRQTALSKDYSEPKDLAIHLYAEIINNDKGKKTMLGAMPDVIAEQAVPRGPYLSAVLSPSKSTGSSPAKSSSSSSSSPSRTTIKSVIKAPSGKMMNRPLPEKPQSETYCADPGEGTSFNLG